eukprot:2912366-Amphidinium_carterae.1
MQRAALCWFHTPRGMFMPNPALRTALRTRLALPLMRPSLTCQYTPATSQRLCGHPLDVYASHCHTCSRGPIKYRHDAIKTAWASLLRQAGWHVTVEQTVTLATSGSQPTKKADLVTISPGGATYALDVIVTHGAPHSHVQQAVNAAEADKCRQYRVSHSGALLPGKEKFLPLVHHFSGMLGAAAFDLANLILRDLASRSAVTEGTPWQMAVGRAREQIFQELTYAHIKAQYRVYRACAATL